MFRKELLFILLISILIIALGACGSQPGTQTNTGEPSEVKNETPAELDKGFYEGKSLEILVPTSPGGGSDIQARLLAPFLSEKLAGNPTVQVVNVPGGGTITGSNEFAMMREANGEHTLWASISTTAAYLLNDPAVQYDYKKMIPIIGYPDGGVVYVSDSTGIKEPKDIVNPTEELIYGGTAITGLPLPVFLSFEVLGVDVKGIFGYESSGPARVAFEQGETNIDFQTAASFTSNVNPLVEEGKAIPLYTLGQVDQNGDIIRDPAFPDLPTVKEVYMEIYGKEPSGIEWEAYKTFVGALFTVQKVLWVHEDVPEEAVKELTEGFMAVVNDPKFIEESKDILNYEPFVGPDVQNLMNHLLDLPDGVQDWVLQYLEENYDVRF